jgi:uncharacterized membrane protein YdjX (TVP38/TMEM64 family)
VFTVAAGVLFGALWGLVLTITGTTLAALAAYGLVRWVGGPLVERHAHRAGFAWVRARLDRSGLLAMISLRLIPMVPFSALNYAAGVAGVRLLPYVVGTVLGVLPGTVSIVVLGDAVTGGRVHPALFAVSVAGAVVGMAGAAIAARRAPAGRQAVVEPLAIESAALGPIAVEPASVEPGALKPIATHPAAAPAAEPN